MNDDDRKLIEQAEALDAAATPGPWEAGDRHRHQPGGNDACFIAEARILLPKLAARLRQLADTQERALRLLSETRGGLTAICRWSKAMRIMGASGHLDPISNIACDAATTIDHFILLLTAKPHLVCDPCIGNHAVKLTLLHRRAPEPCVVCGAMIPVGESLTPVDDDSLAEIRGGRRGR